MYKRVVIKVGTRVLTTDEGLPDITVLRHLAEQIVHAKRHGVEVVLVTSGAMAAGRSVLKVKQSEKLAEKQVLAAVGQVKLMSMYADLFAKQGEVCAQVLASKEDFRDRLHYLNMRTCFENLLVNGVIPIVNENDVVATTELLFTDNDELAGLVASQLNADAVIILSSVDGFLVSDTAAKKPTVISKIDYNTFKTYQKYISSEKTAAGRGGMATKFAIARKLTSEGISVHMAHGARRNVLTDILEGVRIGTVFAPQKKLSSVKRRIAHSEGLAKGFAQVNKCAEEMLLSRTKIMSLLPVGVTKIGGAFQKGDIIEIVGHRKQKLGFGIAQYDSIKASDVLGTQKAKALIHYNHMVIL